MRRIDLLTYWLIDLLGGCRPIRRLIVSSYRHLAAKTVANKWRVEPRASANKSISQSFNKSILKAFSLIEVLVAMAVLAILLTLLLNVVSSTTTLWRHSEKRAEAFREARAALTFISRDMAAALPILTHGQEAQTLLTPATAADWATNRDAVFFLAALPPTAQKSGENRSDICVVGYFAAFEPSGGGNKPPLNLYRYLLSSDETFEEMIRSAGWPLPSQFVGSTSGAIKDIAPDTAKVDLLARNIREFRVEPQYYARTNPDGTQTSSPLPEAVEITIVALHREAAAQFPNKTDWIAGNDALRRDEQTFTTRIPLRTTTP